MTKTTTAPPECRRCHRPVRRRGTDAEGIQYAGFGLCGACSWHEHQTKTTAQIRAEWRAISDQPAPEGAAACTGCGRATRPTNIKAADAPGTVPLRKAGRCARCVRQEGAA